MFYPGLKVSEPIELVKNSKLESFAIKILTTTKVDYGEFAINPKAYNIDAAFTENVELTSYFYILDEMAIGKG